MWPADPFFLVVVGNSRIEAGIWYRRAWEEDSVHDLHLGKAGDIVALGETLGVLGEQWKPPAGSQAKASRLSTGRIRVLLADTWFDSAMSPWNPRAVSAAPLAAHARYALLGAGIELAEDDVVRLADAPYRQPRWTVAYPAGLLRSLEKFAQGLGGELESVAPLGSAVCHVLGDKIPNGSLAALLDHEDISLWRRTNRFSHLLLPAKAMTRPDATPENQVDLLCRRVRLREPGLVNIERVSVIDLGGAGQPGEFAKSRYDLPEIPGAASAEGVGKGLQIAALSRHAVFDVDARQRFARLNPGLLAAACLVLGIALTIFVQAVRVTGAEADARRELTAKTAAAVPKTPPAWSKGELQRVLAVNGAIRELNLPVSALLRAVQPPKDIRVALLGIEFAPGRGHDEVPRLKLTAESRTGEEMARYAAFLAERRPLEEAYLVSHEVAEADPLKPYRFSVEAKWRE